ncbi:porin [Ralstonia syzygii]
MAALACSGFVGSAHAQSSVTLYGIIDVGVNYVTNLKSGNGSSAVMLQDGPPQASRWGLRGSEDLGGGNRAIFTLESGFSAVTGTSSQGSRLFGRQSFVGLQNDRLGTLTLGRQYDAVVAFLAPMTANGTYGGGYFSHIFDNDNTDNNTRITNSIKYMSPSYGGFTFGGLYGLSDQAGGFSNNRAYSFGAGYSAGPVSLGAAYQVYNHPGANADGAVSSNADATFIGRQQQIFGLGGTYTIGPVKAGLAWTRTDITGITSGPIVADRLLLNNFEINARYDITPNVFLAGGYTYTVGRQVNASTETKPKWHQLNLMLDYAFSKRTDVFLISAYQKAAGDATFAFIYGNGQTPVQSAGTAKQAVVRVGIRHKF